MKKADLRKALAQYGGLAQQIATLEKQKQALAQRIQKAMGDADVLQLDEHIVRYKAITSNRFDAQAFRSAHETLYKQFCKPQTVRRFTVA